MSERWRNLYDSWKLAPGNTRYAEELVDEDGEPIDPDELEAQAEAAAEARAERMREDMMFDRENWDE